MSLKGDRIFNVIFRRGGSKWIYTDYNSQTIKNCMTS